MGTEMCHTVSKTAPSIGMRIRSLNRKALSAAIRGVSGVDEMLALLNVLLLASFSAQLIWWPKTMYYVCGTTENTAIAQCRREVSEWQMQWRPRALL